MTTNTIAPAATGTQNAAQAAGQSGSLSAAAGQQLNQSDFLKLLTTQFQNQDPFKPVDDGQFLAQMASFTTANGITQLQQSFQNFVNSSQSSEVIQASALVGHKVLVNSSQAYLPDGGTLTGSVDVSQPVGNLQVTISDSTGQTVRTLTLGQQPQGQTDFSWDGLADNGRAMPAGVYTIQAQTTANGTAQALGTMTAGTVQSVLVGAAGSSPTLRLDGLSQVSLSDVRQIL